MKQIPVFSIHSEILFVSISILIPKDFKTSAEPQFEVIDLLPCLATGMPSADKTKATAVEILRENFPSPPVPHVSIDSSGIFTATIFSLITLTAPKTWSWFIPYLFKVSKNEIKSFNSEPPSMMISNAAEVSSSLSPCSSIRLVYLEIEFIKLSKSFLQFFYHKDEKQYSQDEIEHRNKDSFYVLCPLSLHHYYL